MKHGDGEEKFKVCVYTRTRARTHTHTHQKLDGEPYRTTPLSVVRSEVKFLKDSLAKARPTRPVAN